MPGKFKEGQIVIHKLTGDKMIVKGFHWTSAGTQTEIVLCHWKQSYEWKKETFHENELLTEAEYAREQEVIKVERS